MATQLKLDTLTRAPKSKLVNREWLVLTNEGDAPFNTEGCSVTAGRPGTKGRPRTITTLKAGLIIKAGERVRLVTGSPGKSSQGDPPAEEEGLQNYHLFLKMPYLDKPPLIIRLVNRQQVELCRTTLTKDAKTAPPVTKSESPTDDAKSESPTDGA